MLIKTMTKEELKNITFVHHGHNEINPSAFNRKKKLNFKGVF